MFLSRNTSGEVYRALREVAEGPATMRRRLSLPGGKAGNIVYRFGYVCR